MDRTADLNPSMATTILAHHKKKGVVSRPQRISFHLPELRREMDLADSAHDLTGDVVATADQKGLSRRMPPNLKRVNLSALAKCQTNDFETGDYVEAKWNDGHWFRASVKAVKGSHAKPSYDLTYDGGEEEVDVSAHLLRRPLARLDKCEQQPASKRQRRDAPVVVVLRRNESRGVLVEPLLGASSNDQYWSPEHYARYLVSHERGAAFSSAKAAKKRDVKSKPHRKESYVGVHLIDQGRWMADDVPGDFESAVGAARARDWALLESSQPIHELNFPDSLVWHAAGRRELKPDDEICQSKYLVMPVNPRHPSSSSGRASLPAVGLEPFASVVFEQLWAAEASSPEVEAYVREAALRYGGGEAAALLAWQRGTPPGERNELSTHMPAALASHLPPSLVKSLWRYGDKRTSKVKDAAYEAALAACKRRHRPKPTVVDSNGRVLAGSAAPDWAVLAQHLRDHPDWRLEPGLLPPPDATTTDADDDNGSFDSKLSAARDAAYDAFTRLDQAARAAAQATWAYAAAIRILADNKRPAPSVDGAALHAAKSLGALGAALHDLRSPRHFSKNEMPVLLGTDQPLAPSSLAGASTNSGALPAPPLVA